MWDESGDDDEYDLYVPGEDVRNVFDQISRESITSSTSSASTTSFTGRGA